MISIYDFEDVRPFLNAWIKTQGKKGLKTRIAEVCGVSSTFISLVLSGAKQLSSDQAFELSQFMGLSENETDHLLLLVQIGKAGSYRLKQRLINQARAQAQRIAPQLSPRSQLSNELKAVYYSSWVYSGLRNLTALPGLHNSERLARQMGLPTEVVAHVLEFLLENGLCKLEKGQLSPGPQNTHINAEDPLVNKHHQNWRLRGFTCMERSSEKNLFFTGPMSLSHETAAEIRQLLPKWIGQIMKKVGPSPSQTVYCLNIDWFNYAQNPDELT